jgi:hypothetical protein
MKLLIVQLPSFSRHLIPLRSKYTYIPILLIRTRLFGKNGAAVNAACKENLACQFGHACHRFCSRGLEKLIRQEYIYFMILTRVYLFYDITVLLNAKSTASSAVRSCPSPPLSCVSVPLIVALSGGVCYELTVKVKMVASPVASGVSFVDFSA